MPVPAQKPGKSKQDYGTPADFIAAVTARFGALDLDLEANAENAKAPKFFDEVQNALTIRWDLYGGNLWLNPPFGTIEPWAKKCAEYVPAGGTGRIFFLTPLASAVWFEKWIFGKARVIFLAPRLSFDGKHPFPKDCMLSIFGTSVPIGFDFWRWK